MASSSPAPEAAVLAVFEACRRFAGSKAPPASLLHCGDIQKGFPAGGKERAYAHVGHWPDGTVCVDLPRFAKLSVEHQVGVILHELGHLARPDGGEKEADLWVFEALGIPIEYRGPKTLQWVPRAVAGRILLS